MNNIIRKGILILCTSILVVACNNDNKQDTKKTEPSKPVNLTELIKAAQQEGTVNSLGMPDTWANWEETWSDINQKYKIQHMDTDMSSAQELAKFKAEKNNATADIGDVGASFGPLATQEGLTIPYKTSYWEQIPDWAKDKDGNWLLAYTGTIAFIIDKDSVKNKPHNWKDLLSGKYKVSIGDVSAAAQAVNGVLAANFALGGDETDLTPALNFFAELAKQKRLGLANVMLANLEKGEVDVGIVWDFNGLNYRSKIDPKRFDVVIPQDGSLISGYTTIINKYAKHPNAAKLTREFILSDKGQLNLARGFARPIRASYLDFPEDIKKNMIPESEYQNVHPIQNFKAWEETSKQLPQLWQEKVLIHQQ